eukprot:CAMPEP_0181442806 /NCGR_PEP_ID=MMETSP1110-20121109/24220_1 /TAXON_ID=174948 /ORGANISM="Symbiodinium sp., Strain CCMP421" /LENGTH=75 /DNA_ID=CAMNT_0023566747 /DNA_START=49 /DNA_END=272 /DNA_ORIENTATION=+
MATSLPNIIRLPALVAGFVRVLIMHSPGITNLPVAFTSFAPISESCPRSCDTSDFFMSVAEASSLTMPPLVMALA